DAENRSLSGRALGADIAAHHPAEALRDGEAETGAAIFPGRRGIGLRKIAEEPLQLLGRHADAGIRDGNLDASCLFSNADADGAVFGEFAGIAEIGRASWRG